MISEIKNGSHRESNPAYFEWWYFHFLIKGVGAANVVVHETDIFGENKNPYCSLSFLPNDQSPQYFRKLLPLGGIGVGDYLQVANAVLEDDKKINLDLHFSDPASRLRISIYKDLPAVVINEGVLISTQSGKSYWLVQVPQAAFEGDWTSNGVRQAISGVAYQDHQWGNVSLQDSVSDWIWGHFVSESHGLVYFKIKTQDFEEVDRYIWIAGQDIGVGTSLEVMRDSTANQVNIPGRGSLSFELNKNQLMRSRTNEQHSGFVSSYLRWNVPATLATNAVEQGLGLTEYLSIRKES